MPNLVTARVLKADLVTKNASAKLS